MGAEPARLLLRRCGQQHVAPLVPWLVIIQISDRGRSVHRRRISTQYARVRAYPRKVDPMQPQDPMQWADPIEGVNLRLPTHRRADPGPNAVLAGRSFASVRARASWGLSTEAVFAQETAVWEVRCIYA